MLPHYLYCFQDQTSFALIIIFPLPVSLLSLPLHATLHFEVLTHPGVSLIAIDINHIIRNPIHRILLYTQPAILIRQTLLNAEI